MNEESVVDVAMNFGGLGLLAIFAWLLLKSVLKQNEKLATLLDNHMTTLLERSKEANAVLERICETQKDIGQLLKELRDR